MTSGPRDASRASDVEYQYAYQLPEAFITWAEQTNHAPTEMIGDFRLALSRSQGRVVVCRVRDTGKPVGVAGAVCDISEPPDAGGSRQIFARVALFGVEPGPWEQGARAALLQGMNRYFHERVFKVVGSTRDPVLLTLMGPEICLPLDQPLAELQQLVTQWVDRYPRLTLNEWELVAVSDLPDNCETALAVRRLIACYRGPEGFRWGGSLPLASPVQTEAPAAQPLRRIGGLYIAFGCIEHIAMCTASSRVLSVRLNAPGARPR